jgi:hypothetical protein
MARFINVEVREIIVCFPIELDAVCLIKECRLDTRAKHSSKFCCGSIYLASQ